MCGIFGRVAICRLGFLLFALELQYRGLDGLETPVKGTGVDSERFRMEL